MRRAAGLARAACLLAAVIAAGSIVNSPGFISNNALGYSEGLATAFMLMAVESFIDGHRHRAFAFGIRRARSTMPGAVGSSGCRTACG